MSRRTVYGAAAVAFAASKLNPLFKTCRARLANHLRSLRNDTLCDHRAPLDIMG